MVETADNFLLFELLEKGGILMWPLLVCSLLALAIIIERFYWGPRRSRVIPERLRHEISSLIESRRFEELSGVCRADNSPLARIILTAIRNSSRPRAEILEVVEVAGRNEMLALQKYISLLGTIAAISPLLGLLGTVLGMIQTFAVIQAEGTGNAGALAGGISEALITTATGMTIAIPTLVFYRFFIQKTKRLVVEIETITMGVLDRLTAEAPAEELKANVEPLDARSVRSAGKNA